MYEGLLILDTEGLAPPDPEKGIWENRAAAYKAYDAPGVPRCTVAVTAYNRLEKTKACVECILKYTGGIDYELLLIDNGSEGKGVLEYFESVAHGNKKILRVTKNIGFNYAWQAAKNHFSGKYLVIVSCDIYVTQNWVENLLTCYESDPRIGFVEPVSNNVSNHQQVDLGYTDFEDMQLKAAAYNVSDPLKWEERMRCISLIGIYSRPILDIVGLGDAAYLHDFTEDDLALRIRRAGYKVILCRDTWVCHDHDFRNTPPEELGAFYTRLDYGRAAFREKYRGLDAWDDILNFEMVLLAPLDSHPFGVGAHKTLIVDGRCGTPVLEARNRLRRRGLTEMASCAYTTQAKYYEDLLSVAEEVHCGAIGRLADCFGEAEFDIVAICEPVNLDPEPAALMRDLLRITKPQGLLLYKLRNTFDGSDHAFRQIKDK
jgi:GT2 family glycosyltransferase